MHSQQNIKKMVTFVRNVLCLLLLCNCMYLESSKFHCLQLAQHHIRRQLSLTALWSFLWLSWICVGPIPEITCVNQAKENRPHPTISVMLNELMCSCRVGMWGFHVVFQSPLLLTRWVLGHVSHRTRTSRTTWTSGSLIISPVSVCLAFFPVL